MEVGEELLQFLGDLLVRRPVGEGAFPHHRVVAKPHSTLPVRVALLERAFKPGEALGLDIDSRFVLLLVRPSRE